MRSRLTVPALRGSARADWGGRGPVRGGSSVLILNAFPPVSQRHSRATKTRAPDTVSRSIVLCTEGSTVAWSMVWMSSFPRPRRAPSPSRCRGSTDRVCGYSAARWRPTALRARPFMTHQIAAGVPAPLATLPLAELAPPASLFTHDSTLHGQSHVARVMVHAFRLLAKTGWMDHAPRLWAAVYLHDLARTHDGVCHRHGADAMNKFQGLPHLRELFARGGVADADYGAIHTAVVHHCLPKELDRQHPHWRLTALLKDADGLDRVRLGDLNPRYLRTARLDPW